MSLGRETYASHMVIRFADLTVCLSAVIEPILSLGLRVWGDRGRLIMEPAERAAASGRLGKDPASREVLQY